MKKIPAGILTEHSRGKFSFAYLPEYLARAEMPPVSLTLPKRAAPFESDALFPFFESLLPEGENLETLCVLKKIDPADRFGILVESARVDPAGAVSVSENLPQAE